jgi:hypothetical protein
MKYRPSDDEAACAWVVAHRRRAKNGGQSNLPEETATNEERTLNDYQACLAEIAVSRLLNLCWTGCGKQEHDVGGIFEVRSISDPAYGLQVNERDGDDDPVILVHVNNQSRECTLVGWHFVSAVRQFGKKMRDEKPWWLLPQSKLHRMGHLPSLSYPPVGQMLDNQRS